MSIPLIWWQYYHLAANEKDSFEEKIDNWTIVKHKTNPKRSVDLVVETILLTHDFKVMKNRTNEEAKSSEARSQDG